MEKRKASKILKRIKKRLELDNDNWNLLEKTFRDMWDDIQNGFEPEHSKSIICNHFGITNIEFKTLKMFYWGKL